MWTKLEKLKRHLKSVGSALVAYSGGVDSTLLLKIAHDVLGKHSLGVIVAMPLISDYEVEEALQTARVAGLPVHVLKLDEIEDPRILANTPDRCYYCKANMCRHLTAYAKEHGFHEVLDGTNTDDAQDYRPGQRAARECGMKSPLQEVGLTKGEIRILAREMGLPNWDRPPSACLASRVPYGILLTKDLLQRIGQAERILHNYGLSQLRVRHHGNIARIEVPIEHFEVVLGMRTQIVEALKALGYTYVTLDLEGFRSGSMNEVINTYGHTQAP